MKRPSPALVIACLALFVALGGTSYAAIKLPKNSVGAKQIKKSAVTSTKVKDGSLLAKDFKKGQLPAGAKGDKGDPGVPGPTASGYSSLGTVGLVVAPTMITNLGQSGNTSGPISVGYNARIIATGAIQVFRSSGTALTAYCRLAHNSGSGWNAIPGTLIETDVADAADDVALTVTGSVDVGPGTHDIAIECWRGAVGAGSAFRSSLTAIATAR